MNMATAASAVLVVVFVLQSSSALDNMGPCGKNVLTDVSMWFPLFARENEGSWSIVRAVNTTFINTLQSLTYILEPTSNADEYYLLMTYETMNGGTGTLTEEVMTDLGNGAVLSKGSDFTLNISFLKYVPGRYAIYFICSNDGTDTTIDYRYVLAHGELSYEEEMEIRRIDEQNGFKGGLIPLSP